MYRVRRKDLPIGTFHRIPLSRSPRRARVDGQLTNVQAPHLEVIDGQRAHPPAFHGKCADGETSDRDRTNGRTPKGERAQCGDANGEGASRAWLDFSSVTTVHLFFIHVAPRLWRVISA